LFATKGLPLKKFIPYLRSSSYARINQYRRLKFKGNFKRNLTRVKISAAGPCHTLEPAQTSVGGEFIFVISGRTARITHTVLTNKIVFSPQRKRINRQTGTESELTVGTTVKDGVFTQPHSAVDNIA